MSETQEILDTLYWSKGPCCAGCDWWAHVSPRAGECTKSPPVSGAEKLEVKRERVIAYVDGIWHIIPTPTETEPTSK